MGSQSDWETMRQADEVLGRFNVPHESAIVSAHRTPAWMAEYATTAADRGLEVIMPAPAAQRTCRAWLRRTPFFR
jgi:5-(carboxyamino)imidazole ribonucleotide mutase